MITEDAYSGQTPTYNDPQTADGRPNIESYIKKIFLVSDNDAFNRLYEFLGPEYINEELHRRGYNDAQIIHRLEISLSEDENRHTNPVKFLDKKNNILYSQPLAFRCNQICKKERYTWKSPLQSWSAYKCTDEFLEEKQDITRRPAQHIKKCHFPWKRAGE